MNTQAAQLLISLELSEDIKGLDKAIEHINTKLQSAFKRSAENIGKSIADIIMNRINKTSSVLSATGSSASAGASSNIVVKHIEAFVKTFCDVKTKAIRVKIVDAERKILLGESSGSGNSNNIIKNIFGGFGAHETTKTSTGNIIGSTAIFGTKDPAMTMLGQIGSVVMKTLPQISLSLLALSAISWILDKIFKRIEYSFKFTEQYFGGLGYSIELANKLREAQTSIGSGYLKLSDIQDFYEKNIYTINAITKAYGLMTNEISKVAGSVAHYVESVMLTAKAYGIAEQRLIGFTDLVVRRFWLIDKSINSVTKNLSEMIGNYAKMIKGISEDQQDEIGEVVNKISDYYKLLDLATDSFGNAIDGLKNAAENLKLLTPSSAGSNLKTLFEMWTEATRTQQATFNISNDVLREALQGNLEAILNIQKSVTDRLGNFGETLRVGLDPLDEIKQRGEFLRVIREQATEFKNLSDKQVSGLYELVMKERQLQEAAIQQNITDFNSQAFMEFKENFLKQQKQQMQVDQNVQEVLAQTQSPIERVVNMLETLIAKITDKIIPALQWMVSILNQHWGSKEMLLQQQNAQLTSIQEEFSKKIIEAQNKMAYRIYLNKLNLNETRLTEEEFMKSNLIHIAKQSTEYQKASELIKENLGKEQNEKIISVNKLFLDAARGYLSAKEIQAMENSLETNANNAMYVFQKIKKRNEMATLGVRTFLNLMLFATPWSLGKATELLTFGFNPYQSATSGLSSGLIRLNDSILEFNPTPALTPAPPVSNPYWPGSGMNQQAPAAQPSQSILSTEGAIDVFEGYKHGSITNTPLSALSISIRNNTLKNNEVLEKLNALLASINRSHNV